MQIVLFFFCCLCFFINIVRASRIHHIHVARCDCFTYTHTGIEVNERLTCAYLIPTLVCRIRSVSSSVVYEKNVFLFFFKFWSLIPCPLVFLVAGFVSFIVRMNLRAQFGSRCARLLRQRFGLNDFLIGCEAIFMLQILPLPQKWLRSFYDDVADMMNWCKSSNKRNGAWLYDLTAELSKFSSNRESTTVNRLVYLTYFRLLKNRWKTAHRRNAFSILYSSSSSSNNKYKQ